MAVAFVDDFLIFIQSSRPCSFFQLARIDAEAHGTAFFRDVFLIGHEVDDGIFPVGNKFGRVGLFHVAHVSGKFDNSALHTEAEPKEGNFIFTGITNSVDFPLYTAVAKAAGDDDTINTGKYFIQIRLFFFKDFGIDPADVHLGPHGVSRMGQRFRYGKVGVMEPDIFTDKGDLHFLFCRGHAFYHGFPVFHIHRTIFKSQFFQGDMVETFLFHKKRHFINAVRRQVIDDGFRFHIAKHADFLFHFI